MKEKMLKGEDVSCKSLAAEQRTIVAHSTSYGFNHAHFKSPDRGGRKSHNRNPFLSPHPGLKLLERHYPTVATVGYYRSPLRG